MSGLLPEDQAVGRITDFLVEELGNIRSGRLPRDWRMASVRDLYDAGWTPEGLAKADRDGSLGPALRDPDGRLFEVDIDVTLSLMPPVGAA